MTHNWDIILGTAGVAGSAILGNYHAVMGCVAITFIAGLMALRFRKEWRDRDK